MKKLFTTLLLTISLLVAQDVTQENKNNYVRTNIQEFKTAVSFFKNKQYKNALEIFDKLTDSLIDSQKLDFYIGRSNFELGQYEQTLIAYDRILINEPNNLRVKLEVGLTYFSMGLFKEAKKEYEAVLKEKIPQSVKKNIELQLQAINNKTQKDFFTITGIFGMGYDSNINTQTEDDSVYVPNLNGNVNLTTGVNSSLVSEIGAILSHINKVSDTFIYQNSATLYGMKYIHHDSNNMGLVSLNTTPTYLDNNKTYSIGLTLDHVNYNGKRYLNSYSIQPKLSQALNKNLLHDIYFKFTIKDFFGSLNTNNSKVYDLSNKLSFTDDKLGLFTSELILGRESRNNNSSADTISKDYYTINLSHTYNINKKLAFQTSLSRSQYNYKDQDTSFLTHRKDKKHVISLGIIDTFSKNLSFNTSVQFQDNSSNIVIYDYDKYAIKTYIYYSF